MPLPFVIHVHSFASSHDYILYIGKKESKECLSKAWPQITLKMIFFMFSFKSNHIDDENMKEKKTKRRRKRE